MTRAVVGGINPIDNEFYPLAVNSQGIAQIDTSGIPKPMEWEEVAFTPFYGSTDESFSAQIVYDRQDGRAWVLGDFAFIKLTLRTSNLVITNPRGSLTVEGIPFTWKSAPNYLPMTGGTVGYYYNFKDGKNVIGMSASAPYLVLYPQKVGEFGLTGLEVTDLLEGENFRGNNLEMFYYGAIESQETPARSVSDLTK